jgi:hypothetical protein
MPSGAPDRGPGLSCAGFKLRRIKLQGREGEDMDWLIAAVLLVFIVAMLVWLRRYERRRR